jgi:LPS-assembly protein
MLYEARGVVSRIFNVSGQRVARMGPQQMEIHRGRLTTCKQLTPDWEFRAQKARLGRGNYVHLKNPSFRIKGVPVFYLPYFLFPLRDERTTGFLTPQVGYSSENGVLVRPEFFWAITDWMDATAGVAYYSERGVLSDVQWRYAIDPLSEGIIEGAFIDDRLEDELLWRVVVQQQQEFGWGLRGLTQIDLRSDGDIERRFSNDILRESRVATASFGDLTKRWPNGIMSLRGEAIEGIPEAGNIEQFHQVPALYYDQLETPFFGLGFVGMQASYSHMSASDVIDNEPVQRLDAFPYLTVPFAVAPWLYLSVTGGVRGTFYDRQVDSDDSATRLLPDIRVGLEGPALRRRYARGGAGQAFIHMIEMRLSYRYVPEVEQQDLPGFDTLDVDVNLLDPLDTTTLIDRIEATNYARITLVNSLFAQGLWGLPPNEVREVGRLVLSQGFDMRQASDGDGQVLGPFAAEIELFLAQRWRLNAAVRVDTATGALQASSTRLLVVPASGLSVYGQYSSRQEPEVQYFTGGIGYSGLKWLTLGYNVRIDGLTGDVREHGLMLQYRAQCWWVDLRWRFRNTEDTPFLSQSSFVVEVHLFDF